MTSWRFRGVGSLIMAMLLVAVSGEMRVSPAIAASAHAGTGAVLIASRLPRVLYQGGPFLRHPTVTTVTFAAENGRAVRRLEAFGDFIARSSWWRQVTAGYCGAPGDCIGEGRPGTHVRLARELAPVVRDVDVEQILDDALGQKSPVTVGADELVVVYLPPSVTLRDAFHEQYCGNGPRAYHRMLRSKAANFPYAVIPVCGDEPQRTGVASHEILEATTNPDPQTPGFRIEPRNDNIAFAASGAEPVDPCGLVTRDTHRVTERGFVLQRGWSNREAAAGRNPCVPARTGERYFTLVPREPVVRLAVEGASARVELDAAADRTGGRWTVSAIDLTGVQEHTHYIEARVDRAEVAAGESCVLTLRLLRIHPRKFTVIGLVSRVGDSSHMWPLAISMR